MQDHSQPLDPERIYQAIEEGVYRAICDTMPFPSLILGAIADGQRSAILRIEQLEDLDRLAP